MLQYLTDKCIDEIGEVSQSTSGCNPTLVPASPALLDLWLIVPFLSSYRCHQLSELEHSFLLSPISPCPYPDRSIRSVDFPFGTPSHLKRPFNLVPLPLFLIAPFLQSISHLLGYVLYRLQILYPLFWFIVCRSWLLSLIGGTFDFLCEQFALQYTCCSWQAKLCTWRMFHLTRSWSWIIASLDSTSYGWCCEIRTGFLFSTFQGFFYEGLCCYSRVPIYCYAYGPSGSHQDTWPVPQTAHILDTTFWLPWS